MNYHLTKRRRIVLEYAERHRYSGISTWPDEYLDKDILDCRRAGWLDVGTSGIQMAQAVFGSHRVDWISNAGLGKLKIQGKAFWPDEDEKRESA